MNDICEHLEAIKEIKVAKENVCEECIKIGSDWRHLRTCQTCGITLCCDIHQTSMQVNIIIKADIRLLYLQNRMNAGYGVIKMS